MAIQKTLELFAVSTDTMGHRLFLKLVALLSVNCVPSDIVVYIRCTMFIAKIRIRDGAAATEGRVELYHDNRWGTICDSGWTDREAKVVCTMLGFK